tara:strand:+ start:171 stop:383 length:213 start_codon:yes stop_codon:yes gene_type:complete
VKPKTGEVWNWHPDHARCDEHYGAGIVLGYRDGYPGCEQTFITFHFGHKGVFNLPMTMVDKFMYRVKSKS